MKLLFDVNLSPALVQLLADVCPASHHVANCPISTEDDAIWDFAGANGFSVVSKDSDFYRLSTLLGTPPKVIWLRVGNDGTMAIASLLRASLTSLQQFHDDPTTTLLILGRRSSP